MGSGDLTCSEYPLATSKQMKGTATASMMAVNLAKSSSLVPVLTATNRKAFSLADAHSAHS